MTQETVFVPDIGGSDAAEVVEVLIKPGDTVAVDQGLLVLESDKASMEIPSTVAGKVLEVLAAEGQALSEGAPVAIIETAAEGAAPEGASASAEDSAVESAAESAASAAAPDAGVAVSGSADPAAPAGSGAAAPSATAGTSATLLPVVVPDIGTDDAVDLIELSIAVGDTVEEGDTLVVLESDKASMEVPSPAAGVVSELAVKEGQSVRQGDALLTLQVAGADTDAASASTSAPAAVTSDVPAPVTPAAPPKAATQAATTAAGASGPAPEATAAVYAGPAVRRLAREFGVPLDEVKATGPRGRVLKEDLHAFAQQALGSRAQAAGGAAIPAVPEVDFAAFGSVEVVKRSKIELVTAANMHRSWLNVPHVTQFDDADITELEAFRKSLKDEAQKRDTRITPLPFLVKACAVALSHHEKLNASLSDGGSTLTYKRYIHIGIAVDTPAGLMVPVIRDADKKSLWELSGEVLELAAKARDRKLKPAEMQGASFSVSSLGAIGGRGFTPIVNAPEVAILGVGRSDTRPVWDGKVFQPRLQLPLALSYDHRVVNGGDAGRFLTELCELLGDIRKLLL